MLEDGSCCDSFKGNKCLVENWLFKWKYGGLMMENFHPHKALMKINLRKCVFIQNTKFLGHSEAE